MKDIRADADGAIGVRVGDVFATGEGMTRLSAEWQWRSYRFDGTRFTQVGGPTAFHAVPPETDLQAIGTPAVFGAAVNGVRTATARVTVHNAGPHGTPGVLMWVGVSSGMRLPAPIQTAVDGIVCAPATVLGSDLGPDRIACHLNPLAAGATRTFTVRFTAPVADDNFLPTSTPDGESPLGRVDFESEQPGVRMIVPDLNPSHYPNLAGITLPRQP